MLTVRGLIAFEGLVDNDGPAECRFSTLDNSAESAPLL